MEAGRARWWAARTRSAGESLLDLALPGQCPSCGRPEVAVLCRDCVDQLTAELWAVPRQVAPDPCPDGLPRVIAAGPYAGVLRILLTAYKDGDRRDLLPVLAAVLGRPALAMGLSAGGRLVVPVPSSRAAVRRRGDAPLMLLTRAATGRAAVIDALRPVRPVADQAGLGQEARALNLAGAYAVRPARAPRLVGRRVVLVDDVMTTGATLVEAARALRAAGAVVEAAVTLASTARRPREPPGPRGRWEG